MSIPDPMMRHPSRKTSGWEDSPLFGTSQAAGSAAIRTSGKRRTRILELLARHGEMTLFELAARMGVFDHQISGRVTDLLKDGLIERTGQARRKPDTGCLCDLYRVTIEGKTAFSVK